MMAKPSQLEALSFPLYPLIHKIARLARDPNIKQLLHMRLTTTTIEDSWYSTAEYQLEFIL